MGGSSLRACGPDGTWNGTEPFCGMWILTSTVKIKGVHANKLHFLPYTALHHSTTVSASVSSSISTQLSTTATNSGDSSCRGLWGMEVK